MPDINVNKLSEALNTKADIDLNNTGVFSTSGGGVVNLTSSTPANASGKEVTTADFIKSDIQSNLLNYTTNRILEIPQDIKLELNNGTLTLKAGSKVYVPNGFESDGTTPKFDEVVISSDLTNTVTVNAKIALTVYSNKLAPFLLSGCFSGGSAPTSPYEGTLWYDTANNKMKVYANSIWNERNDCLPIALLTANSSQYTSIDQVFNGFGYIGSTVFVLPGVKVQIPNGRNEDGTYKSSVITSNSVITRAMTGEASDKWIIFSGSGIYLNSKTNEVFDADSNYWKYDGTKQTHIGCLGSAYFDGTKISSFTPYVVDSMVNSNASNFSQAGKSYLSGLGMPSGRYIDLTLGASGTTYTAPANGWFIISGKSTANGGYCILDTNIYEPSYMTTNDAGWFDRGFIPVRKGQVMTLRYGNYEIEADRFKFIYAKGEQ